MESPVMAGLCEAILSNTLPLRTQRKDTQSYTKGNFLVRLSEILVYLVVKITF
jgi:hypothetical protein